MSRPESETCSYCDGERDPDASVRGSYCSLECYHRQKGENALGELDDDHAVCSTCYQQRKDIEHPSESWVQAHGAIAAGAFCGIEYPTRHLHRDDGLTYCECGTVEHYADHGFVKRAILFRTATNLYERLVELHAEDRIADEPSAPVLLDALRETDCDWPLSTGRCIYEEPDHPLPSSSAE